MQDNYSFVVRIWQELRDEAGNWLAWRGSVRDVSTGECSYFDEPARLIAFIEDRVGSHRQGGGKVDEAQEDQP